MSAILAFALLFQSGTVSIPLSDDVWVYPHASDPGGDPFLRIWGSGELSVPKDGEHAEYSYGFLRFDLSKVSKATLKSATLVLTHAANPGWTLAVANKFPLEIRKMKGDFDEKTWTYEGLDKCSPIPGADGLISTYTPTGMGEGEKGPAFKIDLMKDPAFLRAWTEGLVAAKPHLSLGLTSALSVADLGSKGVYKFCSKEAKITDDGPKLLVTFVE